MKNSLSLSALSLAVALALTACGGGGGSDTGAVAPPAAKSELLTDANQPSPYLVASPEKKSFDEINRVRVAGGFGAMQYEEVMSKTATAHTQYVVAGGYFGHIEEVGRPGFTGVTVQDRCNAAAGAAFKFVCGEGGYSIGNVSYSGFDVMSHYSLATGHLQAVLDYQSNRGGLHISTWDIPQTTNGVADAPIPGVMGFINMGYSAVPNVQAGIVGVYPFDSMTAVGIGRGTPGAQFSLQTAPSGQQYWNGYGINIMAQFPTSVNPVVTSFTLRKDGATVDVPTRVHEAGTMNGTEPTRAGWAILIPNVVLDANSKYNVKFVGSHGGVAAEKSWSFTTGSTPDTKMGG